MAFEEASWLNSLGLFEVLLACEGDGLKVADRIHIFWGLQISAGTGLVSEPIGRTASMSTLHYCDLDAPLTSLHFSTSPRLHDSTMLQYIILPEKTP